jgi:NAD(P)H-dependent FMN reductase
MIEVIACTNRKGSNSEKIAHLVLEKLNECGEDSQFMNLSEIDWGGLNHNLYGEDNRPASMNPLIKRIDSADGLYMICPEYNGSFPGVIKTFIDYWSYPKSFEKRPVCFTGLGGAFGGLRPVEHLQQVFGYRNAFIFPERVFLQNVWSILDDKGQIKNDLMAELLDQQVKNFVKFIDGLKHSGLHANLHLNPEGASNA